MTGPAEIGELQERAARAVPAAEEEFSDDGCWLRCTDRPATWWAGAALLHDRPDRHGTPGRDLASRIADAEGFYAAHRALPRFQVCPACPPELDDALSARGYRRSGAVSLQVATTQRVLGDGSAPSWQVDLADSPSADWLEVAQAAPRRNADLAAERRLLGRVGRPSTYATAVGSGRPVAVGRVVTDTGWAGVFSMATIPEARRQGAARAVLAALADQAHRSGAARMYLQVTLDSGDALHLYRRAGFTEVCRYHYRTAG